MGNVVVERAPRGTFGVLSLTHLEIPPQANI